MKNTKFTHGKAPVGCLFHSYVGLIVTIVTTGLGYFSDKYDILGGYAARIFWWQSYELWVLVRSNYVERFEDSVPIYAGYPFVVVWIVGIVAGIPIYAALSMLISKGLQSIRGRP